jgi:hypothetical protein
MEMWSPLRLVSKLKTKSLLFGREGLHAPTLNFVPRLPRELKKNLASQQEAKRFLTLFVSYGSVIATFVCVL